MGGKGCKERQEFALQEEEGPGTDMGQEKQIQETGECGHFRQELSLTFPKSFRGWGWNLSGWADGPFSPLLPSFMPFLLFCVCGGVVFQLNLKCYSPKQVIGKGITSLAPDYLDTPFGDSCWCKKLTTLTEGAPPGVNPHVNYDIGLRWRVHVCSLNVPDVPFCWGRWWLGRLYVAGQRGRK